MNEVVNTLPIKKLDDQFASLVSMQHKYAKYMNDKDKLLIEQYKLAIIEAVKNKLAPSQNQIESNSKPNKKPSVFKKLFAYTYAAVGPFFAGASGYMGCNAIFNLISSVANPVSIGFAMAAGGLKIFLFIVRELRELKGPLGISFFKTDPLIKTYTKQLNGIKEIHRSLLSTSCSDKLSANEYKKYHGIVELFHEDMKERYRLVTKYYKETPLRKVAKGIVSAFDAVLYTGSGFVMGKCMIGLVAASLVSTPIGIAISGAAALFSLVTFCYLRRNNISNVIDVATGNPKKLKKEQENMINHESSFASFDREMKILIARKENQEVEKRGLKNAIYLLRKKMASINASNKDKAMQIKKKMIVNSRVFNGSERRFNHGRVVSCHNLHRTRGSLFFRHRKINDDVVLAGHHQDVDGELRR